MTSELVKAKPHHIPFVVCLVIAIVSFYFFATYFTKGWPYVVPNKGPVLEDGTTWWHTPNMHKSYADNYPVSQVVAAGIENNNKVIMECFFVMFVVSAGGCIFLYRHLSKNNLL